MEHYLVAIKQALPVLAIIFVLVFVLILLIRLIVFLLINQAVKKYRALKKIATKLTKSKKSFNKKDEELFKVKNDIPRAHSEVKAEMRSKQNQQGSGSYELIASEEQELDRKEMEEVKIVDIVEPIGFWTSMILGQKLTYLVSAAQIINKRSNRGFWVSMIEAKERAAGREHGRGL